LANNKCTTIISKCFGKIEYFLARKNKLIYLVACVIFSFHKLVFGHKCQKGFFGNTVENILSVKKLKIFLNITKLKVD